MVHNKKKKNLNFDFVVKVKVMGRIIMIIIKIIAMQIQIIKMQIIITQIIIRVGHIPINSKCRRAAVAIIIICSYAFYIKKASVKTTTVCSCELATWSTHHTFPPKHGSSSNGSDSENKKRVGVVLAKTPGKFS